MSIRSRTQSVYLQATVFSRVRSDKKRKKYVWQGTAWRFCRRGSAGDNRSFHAFTSSIYLRWILGVSLNPQTEKRLKTILSLFSTQPTVRTVRAQRGQDPVWQQINLTFLNTRAVCYIWKRRGQCNYPVVFQTALRL